MVLTNEKHAMGPEIEMASFTALASPWQQQSGFTPDMKYKKKFFLKQTKNAKYRVLWKKIKIKIPNGLSSIN